jgi:maltose alpha-D-glucosyltransferase / alpha-amylase
MRRLLRPRTGAVQAFSMTTPTATGIIERALTRPRNRIGATRTRSRLPPTVPTAKESLWYKNAIIYELHVRSFADSNADGIGDFRGLTQKLDYLQELGVTALWLLPFYPSPLKDDGYDIADYYSINPIYGTLADFKAFLKQAHQRGLRVVTELVVNHTSDQHPWFQRSRRARPGSSWRNFYVWSDTNQKYKEARIIFKDFEPSNWSWDPVAQAYFWHRFYSHQPDLNYDHPHVHKEVTRALDFWLDLGVDGVRLDAVPYLYEREGTSCENLPETHAYLKTLREHVDEKYGDRMLLAEANQWPEDAVSYFGSGKGDECHMAFHFPLMPRLFMALRMEDRVPIVDIMEQTPAIPETSQWALFLRNHDELTLEMVTDEERDYMYRVYANDLKARINLGIRRRLAPLLGNDRKRIELLNLLLFSLPGTPVIYYGDEIGMGDNIFLGDRNGVRTPMQWSSDKNAGFSRAIPHALYLPIILEPEFHYEAVNVETQQRNPHSLLWWMKRAMNLRKRWRAFGQGTLEFLQPENRKILAFLRRFEEETILVVANMSRFPQPVQLNLESFTGSVPVELFGRTEFPIIAAQPYFLTLSPHAAYWFWLKPTAHRTPPAAGDGQCHLSGVGDAWHDVAFGSERQKLEQCLTDYITKQRWFAAKSRQIKSAAIRDLVQLSAEGEKSFLAFLTVDYVEGESEEYLVPLAFATGNRADTIQQQFPDAIIGRLELKEKEIVGVLYDATCNRSFSEALLATIFRRRTVKAQHGALRGWSLDPDPPPDTAVNLEPSLSSAEQSNTSIVYGDRCFLKLFRRLDTGINPDLELARFLTEKAFPHTPAVLGALEYLRENGDVMTAGVLTQLVPNSKDAWSYTLESLDRYFDRVRSGDPQSIPKPQGSILQMSETEPPDAVTTLLGAYLESARVLGRRTAEMHLALASDTANKDFAPEPFTPFYQRSLYQSMRNLVTKSLELLRKKASTLPPREQAQAHQVCAAQPEILKRLRAIYETKIEGVRIRCHGDYHLGQVLYTGKDFVIFDFEGEPARPIGERRIKRSPMRDVAAMIRSFHYAAYAALFRQLELGAMHQENLIQLEPWVLSWYMWISAAFLHSYRANVTTSLADGEAALELLPRSKEPLAVLLYSQLLEKAVYELSYELNNRPAWIRIPLEGVEQLLELPRSA